MGGGTCVPKPGYENMASTCDYGNLSESTCHAYQIHCNWIPDGSSPSGSASPPSSTSGGIATGVPMGGGTCVPKPGYENMASTCDYGNLSESTCHAYQIYCNWIPDGSSPSGSTSPQSSSSGGNATGVPMGGGKCVP